jgi:hypothetical protein
MKKLFILLLTFGVVTSACSPNTSDTRSDESEVLTIENQSSFSVGGVVVETPGTYESQKFDNWKPYPEGQTYHGDHASDFFRFQETLVIYRWFFYMVLVSRHALGKPHLMEEMDSKTFF